MIIKKVSDWTPFLLLYQYCLERHGGYDTEVEGGQVVLCTEQIAKVRDDERNGAVFEIETHIFAIGSSGAVGKIEGDGEDVRHGNLT